jgi:hypothetical protein
MTVITVSTSVTMEMLGAFGNLPPIAVGGFPDSGSLLVGEECPDRAGRSLGIRIADDG